MQSLFTSRTFPALLTLVGTTIGAGILAMPYTFAQSGYIVGVMQLIIAYCLTLIMNLVYAEVLVHVKGEHQLAGYVRIFFGTWGSIFASITLMIGAYGAMLAYVTQAGSFLHTLVPTVSASAFSVGMFSVIALAVFFGARVFSVLETIMVGVLVTLMSAIVLIGIPKVSGHNLSYLSSSLHGLLAPYGVLLFAFSGYSVIPELGGITGYNRHVLRRAIIGGTTLIAVLYLFFTTIVVGITGPSTSPDAITGLFSYLPDSIVRLGIIIAVLGISTSFISLGNVLRNLFHHDLKLSPFVSWVCTVFPVFIIFHVGHVGFVEILQFSGGITVGLSGILLFLMYETLRKRKHMQFQILNISRIVLYVAMGIFALGIGYELIGGLA